MCGSLIFEKGAKFEKTSKKEKRTYIIPRRAPWVLFVGSERITWPQNTFRPCTIALEEAHSTHISDAHWLGRTRTATRSTVATRRPTSPRHRSTAPMRANTRSGRAPLGSGLERRAAHPRMRLEEKATNDPNLMSRLKGHRARGLRAAESRKCQKSAVRREQRDGPCSSHGRGMGTAPQENLLWEGMEGARQC